MCRLLGLVGTSPYWKNFLLEFQKQAETGNVPPKLTAGHKDGWGIVYALKEDGLIKYADRSSQSAFNSERYLKAIQGIDGVPSIILAHLRKASGGIKIAEENSHPFIQKGWAFMHNGTFYDVDGLPVDPDLRFSSDNSDTERLFFFMLSTFVKEHDFRVGWKKLVATIEQGQYDFSAINCIFSNGKTTYAIRWAKKNLSYYTLYSYQLDTKCFIVSSEPLESPQLQKQSWIPIPNKTITRISEDEPSYQLLDGDGEIIHLVQ